MSNLLVLRLRNHYSSDQKSHLRAQMKELGVEVVLLEHEVEVLAIVTDEGVHFPPVEVEP